MDGKTLAYKLNRLFSALVREDGRTYTHQEVSEATGLSVSTISRLRSGGDDNPGFNTIYKICRFFDIPVSYFEDDLDIDPYILKRKNKAIREQVAFRAPESRDRSAEVITEMLNYILELKAEKKKEE